MELVRISSTESNIGIICLELKNTGSEFCSFVIRDVLSNCSTLCSLVRFQFDISVSV